MKQEERSVIVYYRLSYFSIIGDYHLVKIIINMVMDSLHFELHGIVTQPVRSMIRKSHTPSPKNHENRQSLTSREKQTNGDNTKEPSTSASSTLPIPYKENSGKDDNLMDPILMDPSPPIQQQHHHHQQESSFDINVSAIFFLCLKLLHKMISYINSLLIYLLCIYYTHMSFVIYLVINTIETSFTYDS